MDEVKEEVVRNKGGRPRKRFPNRKKQPRKRLQRRAQSITLKRVMKDPVVKARYCINLAKAHATNAHLRLGVPDGWSRGRADMQRVYDGIKADLLLDRMKAEGMFPETQPGDFELLTVEYNGKMVEVRIPKTEAGMAEAALREAIIGVQSPLTHAKDRLNYIRTVLEWTKKKPATDSNVNLSSEEWLDAALKDNDGNHAG
jgi:hypothetical protein